VRRIVTVFVAATILALLGGGVAIADPINSKKAFTFTVDCEGEVFEVVEPFGAGGPLFILEDDKRHMVVKEFTARVVDPETGEVLDTVTVTGGKMVGLEGELVTCTCEPFRVIDPELGEVEIFAEATVLFTRRDSRSAPTIALTRPVVPQGRGAPPRPLSLPLFTQRPRR
jgi:hypothetical protein